MTRGKSTALLQYVGHWHSGHFRRIDCCLPSAESHVEVLLRIQRVCLVGSVAGGFKELWEMGRYSGNVFLMKSELHI